MAAYQKLGPAGERPEGGHSPPAAFFHASGGTGTSRTDRLLELGERDYDKDSAWFSAEQIYGDSTGGVISVADNYPEAARKHVLDSEALLSVNRYDGAGYLAGYAVECTLKTLILVETGQGGGGHNLNDLSTRALQLAGLANQKTAAYVRRPQLTSLTYGPPAGWYEYRRYEPEGTITQADSSAWVAEARRLHDTVIAKMKFDGVIA